MIKTPLTIKITAGITLLLIAISIAVYFSKFGGVDAVLSNKESFGQFGDYIGGLLNPVLTFFTVVLLIWSIRIQVDELSKSTKALEASQKAHEEQVAVSRKELEITDRAHQDQISQLKREAIRKQLSDHAENLLKNCDYLMGTPIFSFDKQIISVRDLIYRSDIRPFDMVQTTIESIPDILENRSKGGPELANLIAIRRQLHLSVFTIVELIPRLEYPKLSELWISRVQELISDCRTLKIIDEEEARIFEEKLSGLLPKSLMDFT